MVLSSIELKRLNSGRTCFLVLHHWDTDHPLKHIPFGCICFLVLYHCGTVPRHFIPSSYICILQLNLPQTGVISCDKVITKAVWAMSIRAVLGPEFALNDEFISFARQLVSRCCTSMESTNTDALHYFLYFLLYATSSFLFVSLFNTVPLHSLKYNSQRLNRCNRRLVLVTIWSKQLIMNEGCRD